MTCAIIRLDERKIVIRSDEIIGADTSKQPPFFSRNPDAFRTYQVRLQPNILAFGDGNGGKKP